MRKLITITALAAVAVIAFAVPASAADRSPVRGGSGSPGTPALPPGVDVSQWPTYLKGSVTGSTHDFSNGVPAGAVGNSCDFSSVEYVGACVPVPIPASPDRSTTTSWRIPNLKLKRERVKVMRSQVQVVYKVASGTVTWSYKDSGSPSCSFTDTFSLKGEKWDIDSRITFFAPKKGRYKNRWRMDGGFGSNHEGPCEIPPGALAGREVGKPSPIARPGKTVRLSHDTHRVLKNNPPSGYGGFSDRTGTLAIRIPR